MDSKRRELADEKVNYDSNILEKQMCSFENNVVEKMSLLGDYNTCGDGVLDV